ncbi:MAG TPA: chemotaxis protein CheW [Candidatus Sulfotelmatobacter sp.]|nr:chemotaxis protein CheW [Candidatus Sulfotelmatobacter sp.]
MSLPRQPPVNSSQAAHALGNSSLPWQEVHRRLERLRDTLASQGVPPPAEQARLLQARAQALARPADRQTDAEAPIEFVAFSLANERYGLEAAFLREVVAVKEITPLPTVPPFVAGIFNLRGQVISVIDLKHLLELPQHGLSDFHTVLVLHSARMEFGLLVDRVLGTCQVRPGELQPALPNLSGPGESFLKGITPDRLALLDGAQLLEHSRLRVYEEV